VAAGLPDILPAAQEAAAGAGEKAGGSGSSGGSRRASPEDAGRKLLQAAEDCISLLQRPYTTITGLQVELSFWLQGHLNCTLAAWCPLGSALKCLKYVDLH
jgi:hypothetical protein